MKHRHIGFALHNTDKSKRMYEIWEKFSNRYKRYRNGTSKRYKSGGCKKVWEDLNNSEEPQFPKTIRYIEHMAENDNPEAYKNIKRDSIEKKIEKSLDTGDKISGLHSDVADVVCDYYQNKFICSGLRENMWYYFNDKKGGKWEMTEMGHELRIKLSYQIVDIYIYYSEFYQEKSNSSNDTFTKGFYDNRVANCGKIIAKLKDSTYKDKLIKECRELFYDKEFNNKINSNLNLVGFDNGVFDLINMEFRYGQPDDYVTISTNYSLPVTKNEMPISLDKLEERVLKTQHFKDLNNDMNEFISQVLPNRKDSNNEWTDDRVRKYVMRFLSSCLSGEVCEEKFYFWTGSGGNGKSKIIELLDHSMGDYSKTLDVGTTTKRGSASNVCRSRNY